MCVNFVVLRKFCEKSRCFQGKFTHLEQILHDRLSWRSRQISTSGGGVNACLNDVWQTFFYVSFLDFHFQKVKKLSRMIFDKQKLPKWQRGEELESYMQQRAFYKGASLRECSPAWHLRRQRPSAHPPPYRSPHLRSSSSWRWSRGSSGHRASRRFLHRCRRCSLLKQGGLLMFSGHSQKTTRSGWNQGDIKCSSLPAGLGGNREFERKFERK